jgi:hypothetical protein
VFGVLKPTSDLCAVWPERLVALRTQRARILASQSCLSVEAAGLSGPQLRRLCLALSVGLRFAQHIAARGHLWVPKAHFRKIVEEEAQ